MKTKFLLILCIILCAQCTFAACRVEQTQEGDVIKIEKESYAYILMDKIRKDRITIYNSLNLTPKQLKCAEEMEKERYEQIEPLIGTLCIQKKELQELIDGKCSKKDILLKQRQVEKTKKEIKKIANKCDKKFEQILNHDQKTKYDMVITHHRHDLKKYQKVQKYGRKQGDLRPFGCKISQPAYSEEIHQKDCNRCKVKNIFKK